MRYFVFVFLVITSVCFGSTVTGPIGDLAGLPFNPRIEFWPQSTPLISGLTNIVGPMKSVSVVNGNFSQVLVAGSYLVKFPPTTNSFTIHVPNNSSTYSLAELSTNVSSISGISSRAGIEPFYVSSTNTFGALGVNAIAVSTNDGAYANNFIGNGLGITNIPSQYNYLGIFAHSLSSGLPAKFGFKASVDATNWVTLGMANFEDGRSNSRLYAPAIARVGTNWVVTYDPFAVQNYGTQLSNVWGFTWSPDLINWAAPAFKTNSFSTNGIVGGPDYYTATNGTVYHYLPLYVAPGAPCYVQTNTDNSGLNWSTPRIIATNITDISILEEDGIVYAFVSNSGLGFDILTNGTSPDSWFTMAKSDLFPTYSIESPQIIKVGVSNYVLLMEMNPNGVCKEYYSRSTNLYNWSAPIPVNEDGVNGSRTKLHHIAASDQAATIRGFIQGQSRVFERTYTLYSTNQTTLTNISLPVGGGTAAKITWSVVASVLDYNIDGYVRVGEWEFQGLYFQYGASIPAAIVQVGDLKFSSRRRPTTDYDVTAVLGDEFVGGFLFTGPWLRLTAPAEQYVCWRVTEKIESSPINPAGGSGGVPLGFDATCLQDFIFTATNSTPPANTSTIRAWVNVTLPDGNTFKMPLYK